MLARTAAVAVGLVCPLSMVVPAEAAQTCAGRRATIVGTPGNDVLHGTRRDDVIVGLDGGDTIRGHGGNDRICGGYGSDWLYGGSGRDRVHGGPDRLLTNEEGSRERIGDRLRGGHGPDRLVPGLDTRPADEVSADLLSWSTSPRGVRIDISRGTASGDGADTFAPAGAIVAGSPYADVITGSDRADEIHGGAGRDALYGYWGADTLYDGAGDDTSFGGVGADQTTGGTGRDDLHGGPGPDVVSDSEPGPNRLHGDRGDDLVAAQLATRPGSVLDGGDGTDRLFLSSYLVNGAGLTTSGVWDMNSGALTLTGPVSASARAVRLEDVDLSTVGSSWRIVGTPGPEALDALFTRGTWFDARAGDDTFAGSPFDDVFLGGSGSDSSPGLGGGADTCVSVEDQPDCETASP